MKMIQSVPRVLDKWHLEKIPLRHPVNVKLMNIKLNFCFVHHLWDTL